MLALLDGELHGYALMRRVGELSDGAVRMGPGTLYGTLNRLVADGLIVETTDRVDRDESERRRYYELTAEGRAVALAELARLKTLVHRATGHLAGGAAGVNGDRPALRLYRVLLRLYPREFRDEYGADMVRLLRDQSARRTGVARRSPEPPSTWRSRSPLSTWRPT